MYDDKHMLKVVQHATASALNSQEATATFLLLPNLDGKQHQRFSQNNRADNNNFSAIIENTPKIGCYMF